MVQPLWNNLTVPQMLYIELKYDPAILPWGDILKRTENIYSHKNLYTNVYSSIICNSQKVETTQMYISNKKEWSTDTCYSTDEPWKHYAVWKKPAKKIIYFMVLFTISSRIGKFIEIESRLVVARGWGGRGMTANEGGGEVLLEMMKCSKIRLCWWLHNSADT